MVLVLRTMVREFNSVGRRQETVGTQGGFCNSVDKEGEPFSVGRFCDGPMNCVCNSFRLMTPFAKMDEVVLMHVVCVTIKPKELRETWRDSSAED